MSLVRVQVLGPLTVTVPGQEPASPPTAAHRLVALIAAAGPDGIARDVLAAEIWGDPVPASWMSALRNRLTTARKMFGPDTISNHGGHLRFAPTVTVDSWDVITHAVGQFDSELSFLEGEPFLDIEPCNLVRTHASHVADARDALIRKAVGDAPPLSPRALQSLRIYQRRHPQRATVAIETVRAHVLAGEVGQAVALVDEVKASIGRSQTPSASWVHQLDELIETNGHRQDSANPTSETEEQAEAQARAEMFAAAASEQDWNLALEVALAGLPAASKSSGDPERLALLEQVPANKLDPSRRFNYCLTMTRQLMYGGRDDEAQLWASKTRALAETPDQELLSFIMRALVGDSDDERTPIPLPDAFEDAPNESVNMQSLQVAVMSHLERAASEDVAPLQEKFTTLVEASADPYRRWHLLLLESMNAFVAGEIEAASTAAWRAFRYADVFGIADAEGALIGQLSNASLVHAGFPAIDDVAAEFPASADLQPGRMIQAVANARAHGGEAVDDFLRSYNYNSRSFFTFPAITLLAPYIVDEKLRSAIARRLMARTGTSAIWGTGVLHLGPVDRTLAMLTHDKVEREVHLAAAVQVADRQRTPLWQVVSRLDLAQSTQNAELLRQAHNLASLPALQELVNNYQSRF